MGVQRPERPGERYARHIVSEVLGVRVNRHDDGTRDAMVDAVIHLPEGLAALEVVADEDGESLALWAALEKRKHHVMVKGLSQAWWVAVRRTARLNLVEAALPELLGGLEAAGLPNLTEASRSGAWQFLEQADALGVYLARCYDGGKPPGYVAVRAEGWAGWSEGPDFAAFVDEMLATHDDVPRKLAAHPDAVQRHVFLWVTFSSDMAVQSGLEDRGQQPLPETRDPRLPEGVSHVWVASRASSQGVVAWFPDRGWWRTPWAWPSEKAHLAALFGALENE